MSLHPIPTNEEAWHALRAAHVGASEVAALFGAQPDYAPGLFALWHVKAGSVPRENVDNPRVRWGLRLEEVIAEAAAAEEDWTVEPGQYASRGGVGATLDRIIAGPGPKEREAGLAGPGVLELKNADWLTHRRGWGNEPPLHILLQLQAQLYCTGFGWGAVAVLVGGNDLRIYRYFPRAKIFAEIERRVAAFWQSVRDGRAPKPDASDSALRAIRLLEPEIVDEAADLSDDNEAPILAAEYLAAQAEEKAAAKRKAEARNQLLAKLGGHRWAKVPGFRLSQAVTPEKPPVEITAEMVGTTLPDRAQSVRLIVSEKAA